MGERNRKKSSVERRVKRLEAQLAVLEAPEEHVHAAIEGAVRQQIETHGPVERRHIEGADSRDQAKCRDGSHPARKRDGMTNGRSERMRRIPRVHRYLIERDGPECYYCGFYLLAEGLVKGYRTVEHLEPLSRGGADTPENWVLACKPCNTEAGDRSVAEKQAMRRAKRRRRAGRFANALGEGARGPAGEGS